MLPLFSLVSINTNSNFEKPVYELDRTSRVNKDPAVRQNGPPRLEKALIDIGRFLSLSPLGTYKKEKKESGQLISRDKG